MSVLDGRNITEIAAIAREEKDEHHGDGDSHEYQAGGCSHMLAELFHQFLVSLTMRPSKRCTTREAIALYSSLCVTMQMVEPA